MKLYEECYASVRPNKTLTSTTARI